MTRSSDRSWLNDYGDNDDQASSLEDLFYHSVHQGRSFTFNKDAISKLFKVTTSIEDSKPVMQLLVQRSNGPRKCVPFHVSPFIQNDQTPVLIIQQISVRPTARCMGICTSFVTELMNVAHSLNENLLFKAVQSPSLMGILKEKGFHSINPPHEAQYGDFGYRTTQMPLPRWDLHKTIVLTSGPEMSPSGRPQLPMWHDISRPFLDVPFCGTDSSGRRQTYTMRDVRALRSIPRDTSTWDEERLATLVAPRDWAGVVKDCIPANEHDGYSINAAAWDSKLADEEHYQIEGVIMLLHDSYPVPEKIRSMMMEWVHLQPNCIVGYAHLQQKGRWYYRDGTSCDADDGISKACFYNVYVQKGKGKACYGFAIAAKVMCPLAHAWRVDDEGNVVELTPFWESETWYFGVEVAEDIVTELVEMNTPAQCDVLFATQWLKEENRPRIQKKLAEGCS